MAKKTTKKKAAPKAAKKADAKAPTADAPAPTPRLWTKYQDEIKAAMKEKFGYANPNAIQPTQQGLSLRVIVHVAGGKAQHGRADGQGQGPVGVEHAQRIQVCEAFIASGRREPTGAQKQGHQ